MRHGKRECPARQAVMLALAVVAVCLTHRASATEWTERDFAQFRLLTETTGTAGRSDVLIGLEVDLDEGWIFSSRTPGDFGVAPVFDWSASRNLARATIHWPEPRRVVYSKNPPVSLLGYKDALLLPIVLTAEFDGQDVDIRLLLDYALCHDYCIVDTVDLGLVLPAGEGETTLHALQLRKALAEAKSEAR